MPLDTLNTPIDLDPRQSRDWMAKIVRQQLRCNEENGVLRNLYKQAKADGENVAEMRKAIRDAKKDATEVISDLRHHIRYLQLRHIPLDPNSLFAGQEIIVPVRDVMDDDETDIITKGYTAGRHAVDIAECPYRQGSPQAVMWLDWWKRGQAAIARELGPDTKQAEAPRQRVRDRQGRIPGTEARDRPRKMAKANGNGHAKRAAAPKKKGGKKSKAKRAVLTSRGVVGPAVPETTTLIN